MSTQSETSDGMLVDLLRRGGPLSIAEMATALAVTATAVRQRLTRLMGQGLVERDINRTGRGRPSHKYRATAKARHQAGTNAPDLALALWDEIRAVADPAVKRGLLERLAQRLARFYAPQVMGESLDQRVESVRNVFAERNIPLVATLTEASAPVEANTPAEATGPAAVATGLTLQVLDCPYGELAEHDRGVCAMERMLFSELLATPVKLTECRLDGHACCQFQTT
ncbi:MAG: transcriptional regulator [Planctomycetes bacterium]|nr:transcriptional regulator [Planctomycetota bacterium]